MLDAGVAADSDGDSGLSVTSEGSSVFSLLSESGSAAAFLLVGAAPFLEMVLGGLMPVLALGAAGFFTPADTAGLAGTIRCVNGK